MVKSEFKPVIDGLAKDAPSPLVAIALCRLMPDMIKLHEGMAQNLLWGFWETLSELLTDPELVAKMTKGQRCSAAILTEYFCQHGDWKKMADHIAKQMSDPIPQEVIMAMSDSIYDIAKEALGAFVDKLTKEGRWPKKL